MANLSRDGHRQRIKAEFVNNPDSIVQDYKLLELYLTYAIPRKDVKPIAYELMNKYHTLENVFNASIDELQEVEGIGESAAILFALHNVIDRKIELNKNKNSVVLKTAKDAAEYVNNMCKNIKVETFIVITLNNSLKVINYHFVETGTANHIDINPQKILTPILLDKAPYVIVAHNHPGGKSYPSIIDGSFTAELSVMLRKLGISLYDHVIVGAKDTTCMSQTTPYSKYFDR